MRRRQFIGAVAALATSGAAGCISVNAASTTETHEFEVPDESDVVVSNSLGGVAVERGDEGPLRVRAEKHDGVGNDDALDNVRVETKAVGDEFEVFVVDERDGRYVRATELHLDLVVPPGVAVTEVNGDDGEVTVDGVGGDLDLRADDADVDVRNRDGDVTATVDDGDLTIEEIGGDVTVCGDDGNVTVDGVGGDVSVDVDDGDVRVTDVGGSVSMDYDDGDVRATDVGAVGDVEGNDGDAMLDIPAVRDDTAIDLDDGQVTARLGTDLDVQLVIVTDRGEVDTSGLDGRFAVEGDVDRFETELGDATHTLRIETDDGDVTLGTLD